MARYAFKEIEAKWQRLWDERGTFVAPERPTRPKYYALEMFPYPSGRIHMGHVRNYTLGDVVARFRRAQGYDVLHPMGWDAFGLPAENAAMAKGVHPAAWTYANIEEMRAQIQVDGPVARLDARDRHLRSRLLPPRAGDVPRFPRRPGWSTATKSWVNWDPVDQTVLANEQVIDGRGWRSGAPVERRKLAQWFFRITAYNQELLDALAGLERWPDKVRLMQERWIGRSEGARVRFPIIGRDAAARGLHDPAGHAVRRELHGDRAGPSAQRRARRAAIRASPPSSPNAPASAPARRSSSRPRRSATTPACAAATRWSRPGAAGLRRQLRADGVRQRGDLRLPGARPARSRVRPPLRPAGPAGGPAAGRGSGDASRSATRPISATAGCSTPASSTGSTSPPPSAG